jgi:hypothetical protein
VKWRPRFTIAAAAIDFAPMYPTGAFGEPIDTAGGTLESGAGVPASFVVRRDHWLTVPVRIDETEVAAFFDLMREAQKGATIVWTPDVDDPGTTYAVKLASPSAAEEITLEPDGAYPLMSTVALTFRRVDGAAWDLDYYADPDAPAIVPATRWCPRFSYGASPTTFRLPLPVTRWRPILGGLGGARWTAEGALGAWRQTDRSRLAFAIRYTAAEWPSVRAWLAWAQTGAPFDWEPDPDNEPGISLEVYLDAPQAGARIDPIEDAGFPRVRLLPILIRRVDGADFALDYFPD